MEIITWAGGSLVPVDFPSTSISSSFIMTRRTLEVLREVLSDDAEFLPLDNDEQELWALNPLKVLDALDLDRSTYWHTKPTLFVRDYVFKDDVIGDAAVFHLPPEQRVVGGVYVTERFVAEVEKHHLTGLTFKHLWG
ncbi:imm11 family protein [Compostimonas suwonensis]|uniref:imm11 family protein n=1 Tax=Compostimonas suwonensis TaxID=1048394 RepID=UPI0012FD2974|nr:DUF1629 domain-containing protein [Compostimonas suwonensis]